MIVLILAITFIVSVTIFRLFKPRSEPRKAADGNAVFVFGDSGSSAGCGHGGGDGGGCGGGGH